MTPAVAQDVFCRLALLTKGRFIADTAGLFDCTLKDRFVDGEVAMVIIDQTPTLSRIEYVPHEQVQWLIDLYAK